MTVMLLFTDLNIFFFSTINHAQMLRLNLNILKGPLDLEINK